MRAPITEDRFKRDQDVMPALNYTLADVLPKKVVARVKRQLRRYTRKPADMTVRQYYQHLRRINEEEIPLIPPGNGIPLTEDEILDILLASTPKAWEKEMDRQRFDPLEKTMTDVIEFMEGVEMSEDFNNNPIPKKKDKGKSTSGNSSLIAKSQKHCMLHVNCGHDTANCSKLQAEAKRLKSNNNNNYSGKSHGSGKGKCSNKTWSRKADESKAMTTKEINSLIKAQVQKGVQQELMAMDKKRKAAKSSNEEGEINMADLAEFNYEDMENLVIDDKDSISV